jgi:hypothetical protein
MTKIEVSISLVRDWARNRACALTATIQKIRNDNCWQRSTGVMRAARNSTPRDSAEV